MLLLENLLLNTVRTTLHHVFIYIDTHLLHMYIIQFISTNDVSKRKNYNNDVHTP